MKHVFTFLLFFTFLSLNAQSKWQIGISGGANFSNEYNTFKDLFFIKARYTETSGRYGIKAQYNFKEKYGIGIELNRELRGYYANYLEDLYFLGTHRISFPVILERRIGKKRNFYTNVGANLAVVYTVNYGLADNYERLKHRKYWDYGVLAGIGYRYFIKPNISANVYAGTNISVATFAPTRKDRTYAYTSHLGIAYHFGK